MNSKRAGNHVAGMTEPLHVASPLLFEFRQSARWQSWLYANDASNGFPRAASQAVLSNLHANIAAGAVVVAAVDWADIVAPYGDEGCFCSSPGRWPM